jgi:HEAT repeat protein
MERGILLLRITQRLSQVDSQISLSNSVGLRDLNTIAEEVMRPVLAITYGLPNLENLNSAHKDYPAVDLGDRDAGVGIQVTSRFDSAKVNETIRKAVRNNTYDSFPDIRVFILRKEIGSLKGKDWGKLTNGKFKFDRSNVFGIDDLLFEIKKLTTSDLRKIDQILEEEIGGGGVPVRFETLREACGDVSKGVAASVLNARLVIERESIREKIRAFIASSNRYAVVVGRSSVGKSTFLASEIRRFMSEGYTVIAAQIWPGKKFTLDNVAEQIRLRIPNAPSKLEWDRVLRPWENTVDTDPIEKKLVIIFDGLEIADTEHIAEQLAQLDRSLALHSPMSVKVVLSCRDSHLRHILSQDVLTFDRFAGFGSSPSNSSLTQIPIEDFSDDELDQALQELGATELLPNHHRNLRDDPHVSSMRALLKHPGTFESYADLFARGEIERATAESWSSLINRRIERCLDDAEKYSGHAAPDLRQMLIHFSRYCWDSKITEFALSGDVLELAVPDLFREGPKAISPLIALKKVGVLNGDDMVEFGITDAGPLLLSFQLENQFREADPSERKMLVSAWFKDRFGYWPLLDAVIALVDRLSGEPARNRKTLLTIIDLMIETHQDLDLFRLFRPSILRPVMDLVKETNKDSYLYRYKEVALQIRYSEQNLHLIESSLRDPRGMVREIAAALVGRHKLETLIPDIIECLNDDDEDVRLSAFKSVAEIGERVLDPLIEALEKHAGHPEKATRIVWGIINVGYRSPRLSLAVTELLENQPGEKNPQENRLHESLLLLSGKKRDESQVGHAMAALLSTDERVSLAAAKYFTDVPVTEAFQNLLALLRQTDMGSLRGTTQWKISQLIAAILAVDHDAGEPIVTDFLNSVFSSEASSKLWVADVARKRRLAGVYPTIYQRVVRTFAKGAKIENVWYRLAEDLIKIWQPEALSQIKIASGDLISDGIDPARIFVDAMLPHIREDSDRYVDRLNRVSDLFLAMMSGSENFAQEAVRFFGKTSRFGTKELADFFWILEDDRFDTELIDQLEKEVEKSLSLPRDEKRLTASYIARALASCATGRSVEAILAFIRDEPEAIHFDFAKEVLVPLLSHGSLRSEKLVDIAIDPANHFITRSVCLDALALFDPSAFEDLFQKVAEETSEFVLRKSAVMALGRIKSSTAKMTLRMILRRNDTSEEVRGWCAFALGVWMKDRDSLTDIENAFQDLVKFNGPTVMLFVAALNSIGETTAPVLDYFENNAERQDLRDVIYESNLEHPRDPGNDTARIKMLEDYTSRVRGFRDPQATAVELILDTGGRAALEAIAEFLEKGRLTTESRHEIVRHIRKLANDKSVDRGTVLRILRTLIVDIDPHIRYDFLATLEFLGAELCDEVYRSVLDASEDEWERSCAVESLGYWGGDPKEIENRRLESAHLVRQSSDLASEQRRKRSDLDYHFKRFQETTGVDRLVSYICLKNNGDRRLIRKLFDLREVQGALSQRWAQTAYLIDEIRRRLQNEERGLERAQEKRLNERGHVMFD